MKTKLFFVCFMCILWKPTFSINEQEVGIPIKYISGFEIDLDSNGEYDTIVLIERSDGQELIVLMKKENKYIAHILAKGLRNELLATRWGNKEIIKSISGTEYCINGPYIMLKHPEGPAVIYFWDERIFQEVWISK